MCFTGEFLIHEVFVENLSCLLSSLAHFLIGSFIFLELSCRSCLYIFEISCLSVVSVAIIFHRTRTNNFKICMEIQKTSNSQSNLEKEEWNWRNQLA